MQISQSATSNVKTVHLQQLLITETLDIEGVLSALNPCSSPSWDILGYLGICYAGPQIWSPLSQGPGEASKAGERRSKWIRRNTTHRNDETMLFVKDSFGWGARNGCWLDKVKSPASILFFITMNTLLRRMIHYIYVVYIGLWLCNNSQTQ